MKLCSFLIPTRNASHKSLAKSVQSIRDNGDDYEILLRVDDDDVERHEIARELVKDCGRVVIGPRGTGYNNMGTFVQDLVAIADSHFCWLFDDDAYVEGNWYEKLRMVNCDPVKGPAVNAEFYVLGQSYYKNGSSGEPCGIIIPTELAKTIPRWVLPVDDAWLNTARGKGFSFSQLEGVHYHHDGRGR